MKVHVQTICLVALLLVIVKGFSQKDNSQDSTILEGNPVITIQGSESFQPGTVGSRESLYAKYSKTLYIRSYPLSNVCELKFQLTEKQSGKPIETKTELLEDFYGSSKRVSKVSFIPPNPGKYELKIVSVCAQNTFLKGQDGILMDVSGEFVVFTEKLDVLQGIWKPHPLYSHSRDSLKLYFKCGNYTPLNLLFKNYDPMASPVIIKGARVIKGAKVGTMTIVPDSSVVVVNLTTKEGIDEKVYLYSVMPPNGNAKFTIDGKVYFGNKLQTIRFPKSIMVEVAPDETFKRDVPSDSRYEAKWEMAIIRNGKLIINKTFSFPIIEIPQNDLKDIQSKINSQDVIQFKVLGAKRKNILNEELETKVNDPVIQFKINIDKDVDRKQTND